MNTNYEKLFETINSIASREDFITYVNSREFEEKITNIVKNLKFDENSEQVMLKKLECLIDKDKNQAFVLFFILFTKKRRNRIGDLKYFTNKYIDYFNNIKFTEFISLLCQYSQENDEKKLLKILKRTDRLIQSKGENYDFTSHLGIKNLYVEIVCKYFESQLDDRFDEQFSIYLKKANQIIDNLLNHCQETDNSNKNLYEKFYLNKGRLLILLGKYIEGEDYINRAIAKISINTTERDNIIREYQQYLIKATVIKVYDTTSNKIKELDSIKINNTKILALMTSLLGFLLGSINIFSSVTDVFTLAMLMMSYVSLLFVLTGIVLLGLNLTFNEKRKKFIIYDSIICLIGILSFTFSIIIILK